MGVFVKKKKAIPPPNDTEYFINKPERGGALIENSYFHLNIIQQNLLRLKMSRAYYCTAVTESLFPYFPCKNYHL